MGDKDAKKQIENCDMKKILMLLFSCLVLSGCATTPYHNAYQDTYRQDSTGYNYYTYEVYIASEPPGVRVEWNNEYAGKTPFVYFINGHVGYLSNTIIMAYPISPRGIAKTKYLDGFSPIPKKIYFDMRE